MPFRKLAPLGKLQPPAGSGVDWGNPITRGLVCRLPLNEPSRNMQHDLARGNVATAQNFSLLLVNGLYGRAMSFDNNGSAGQLKLSKPLLTALPMTFMGWAYNATGTANLRVLCIAGAGTDNDFVVLYVDNATGFVNADSSASNVQAAAVGGTDIRNKWTQVVGVFASITDRRVYVNGRQDGSDTTSNSPNFTLFDSIESGALQRTSILYGTGVVSNLSVWNRALSPGEIRWLFANPFGDILTTRRRVSNTSRSTNNGRMFLTY